MAIYDIFDHAHFEYKQDYCATVIDGLYKGKEIQAVDDFPATFKLVNDKWITMPEQDMFGEICDDIGNIFTEALKEYRTMFGSKSCTR